jgi:hypothetical protein
MLILSGHGSGAVGDFLGGDVPTSRLAIRDLPEIFKGVSKGLQTKTDGLKSKIDILGLDSCLMSMAEVACEVQEYVDFMIGAEGFEANTGWPYARLVQHLLTSARPLPFSPLEVANVIVKDYIEYYQNYTLADLSTDLSAVDLNKLDKTLPGNLITEIKTLADMMTKKLGMAEKPQPNHVRDAILLAHWEAQSYKNEQYTDLWDFCDVLARRCDGFDPELAAQAVRVREATSAAVTKSGYCGAAFQHSRGLSVFFPWAEMKDARGTSDLKAYNKLNFATSAGWHDFLVTYLGETQRLPRDHHKKEGSVDKKDNDLVKTSRINYRPGIYTTLALAGREEAPASREEAPADRYLSGGKARIGPTKNPSEKYYPCDLIDDGSLKKKSIEKTKQ